MKKIILRLLLPLACLSTVSAATDLTAPECDAALGGSGSPTDEFARTMTPQSGGAGILNLGLVFRPELAEKIRSSLVLRKKSEIYVDALEAKVLRIPGLTRAETREVLTGIQNLADRAAQLIYQMDRQRTVVNYWVLRTEEGLRIPQGHRHKLDPQGRSWVSITQAPLGLGTWVDVLDSRGHPQRLQAQTGETAIFTDSARALTVGGNLKWITFHGTPDSTEPRLLLGLTLSREVP